MVKTIKVNFCKITNINFCSAVYYLCVLKLIALAIQNSFVSMRFSLKFRSNINLKVTMKKWANWDEICKYVQRKDFPHYFTIHFQKDQLGNTYAAIDNCGFTKQTQNALNFFYGKPNFSHVFQLYDTIHTNFVALFRFEYIFFCYTNKKNLKFKKFLNKKQIASYIGKCMYTKIRYLWIKVNKNET